jgi:hypothetical protein
MEDLINKCKYKKPGKTTFRVDYIVGHRIYSILNFVSVIPIRFKLIL